MNRKGMALLLALCLVATLCVSAFADGNDGKSDAAADAGGTETETRTESLVSVQTAPADTAAGETGSSTAAGDDSSSAPSSAAEEAVYIPDAVGSLSYANLEKRLREKNLTILMLDESIASIDAKDFDRMQEDLRKQLNNIAKAQYIAIVAPEMLAAMGMEGATFNSLQSSYDALKGTFDDLRDGKIQKTAEAAKRQLENTEQVLVSSAQSLYVTILELQGKRESLGQQLSALDSTVKEMQLRYDLGQISALQLQQVKSGRTSLQSGLDTLEMSLRNCTLQLQSMIGAELTGSLTLTEVPEITAEQLSAMDSGKDMETARAVSYNLYAAQKALDDAKDDFDDVRDQYKSSNYNRKSGEHTYEAAKYTYQNAVQSFELGFQPLYAQVQDYRQVLSASQTALHFQQSTYDAAALKYQQGTISKNALQSAKNELDTAQATVDTNRRNLFIAYNNYLWAVNDGLMN